MACKPPFSVRRCELVGKHAPRLRGCRSGAAPLRVPPEAGSCREAAGLAACGASGRPRPPPPVRAPLLPAEEPLGCLSRRLLRDSEGRRVAAAAPVDGRPRGPGSLRAGSVVSRRKRAVCLLFLARPHTASGRVLPAGP